MLGGRQAKYYIGPLDPLVLFVGRLATQKGPDLLVEAVPMVLATRSDVKFVFVGDGSCVGVGPSGDARDFGGRRLRGD